VQQETPQMTWKAPSHHDEFLKFDGQILPRSPSDEAYALCQQGKLTAVILVDVFQCVS